MKSLYFCSIFNFVVIKITRVLFQLKKNYYHKPDLWYISKIEIKQIFFIKKVKKLTFLIDRSTFQNDGNGLFSLKNCHTTIYGRPFSMFLPSASLDTIIYGRLYGNTSKTKLK
jgi:hypothetical protein